jgi:hypothetical protein
VNLFQQAAEEKRLRKLYKQGGAGAFTMVMFANQRSNRPKMVLGIPSKGTRKRSSLPYLKGLGGNDVENTKVTTVGQGTGKTTTSSTLRKRLTPGLMNALKKASAPTSSSIPAESSSSSSEAALAAPATVAAPEGGNKQLRRSILATRRLRPSVVGAIDAATATATANATANADTTANASTMTSTTSIGDKSMVGAISGDSHEGDPRNSITNNTTNNVVVANSVVTNTEAGTSAASAGSSAKVTGNDPPVSATAPATSPSSAKIGIRAILGRRSIVSLSAGATAAAAAAAAGGGVENTLNPTPNKAAAESAIKKSRSFIMKAVAQLVSSDKRAAKRVQKALAENTELSQMNDDLIMRLKRRHRYSTIC